LKGSAARGCSSPAGRTQSRVNAQPLAASTPESHCSTASTQTKLDLPRPSSAVKFSLGSASATSDLGSLDAESPRTVDNVRFGDNDGSDTIHEEHADEEKEDGDQAVTLRKKRMTKSTASGGGGLARGIKTEGAHDDRSTSCPPLLVSKPRANSLSSNVTHMMPRCESVPVISRLSLLREECVADSKGKYCIRQNLSSEISGLSMQEAQSLLLSSHPVTFPTSGSSSPHSALTCGAGSPGPCLPLMLTHSPSSIADDPTYKCK
jgi:hypothetical protein